MSIQVKWFPTLVKRTHSKKAETTVAWRPGLTPLQIFLDEGFSEVDAEAVMVVVNDGQANLRTELQEGDRLEFIVSIQGG
jgi:sulfur carrier protein ThiS